MMVVPYNYNIIILTIVLTIAHSIQYSNTLYMFVAYMQ